jgi:hypothetical protein
MKVTNCSYSSSDRASAMPGSRPLTEVDALEREGGCLSISERITG